jgi:pyruvate/oxaloacetate carboxyltransferase
LADLSDFQMSASGQKQTSGQVAVAISYELPDVYQIDTYLHLMIIVIRP